MDIKVQSHKIVQNQLEHIIFQNTRYSEALINQYNYRSIYIQAMYQRNV